MGRKASTARRTPHPGPTERMVEADPSAAFIDDMKVHAHEAANLLKVLSHETRLLVLCHLSRGELSVGEINERMALSQSALSQHLAELRTEGLVATRHEGQSIFYRIAGTNASEILAMLHELYCGSAGGRK